MAGCEAEMSKPADRGVALEGRVAVGERRTTCRGGVAGATAVGVGRSRLEGWDRAGGEVESRLAGSGGAVGAGVGVAGGDMFGQGGVWGWDGGVGCGGR